MLHDGVKRFVECANSLFFENFCKLFWNSLYVRKSETLSTIGDGFAFCSRSVGCLWRDSKHSLFVVVVCNVGFLKEDRTGIPGEKPFGARERTNNNLNPHMALTLGFEPGPDRLL